MTTTRFAATIAAVILLAAACTAGSTPTADPATEVATSAPSDQTTEEPMPEPEPTDTALTDPVDEPVSEAPTESSTTTTLTTTETESTTTEAASQPDRVDDFDGSTDWFIVNDGVMGGRSLGNVDVDGRTMSFTGTIVTDGGGFTSVRRTLGNGELADSEAVTLRVRADSRIYGLILDDRHEIDGRNVSFRADLDTSGATDDDGWQTVTVAYDQMVPTIFGRVVEAPAFVPDEATEIGLIIADGLDGDFAIDVDWIDTVPRSVG